MLKREIRSHLLITFIWLLLITLLRWNWHWNLIFLWLGGLIGTFLLDLDHLLYTFFIYPQELTSIRVKQLVSQRQFKEVLILLADTQDERFRLPFHSALFQLILYVVCFFVLTSTGSLFGGGLVMAMALHLLKDEFELLFKGRDEQLHRWLFWQVKTEISFRQQKFFVVLMLFLFIGLNILLI
jgi:hypothetical protein